MIRAPDNLFVHLANFFRGILIHGTINASLLICAIVLLVKDKKGAIDDSANYRGIALSSVLLKVFDWIVLLLFEDKLCNDLNQFGYQNGSSANMCTWAVIETVNHFVKKGSPVYACLLDYRKAFDLCNHVVLFKNLIDRKFSATSNGKMKVQIILVSPMEHGREVFLVQEVGLLHILTPCYGD